MLHVLGDFFHEAMEKAQPGPRRADVQPGGGQLPWDVSMAINPIR